MPLTFANTSYENRTALLYYESSSTCPQDAANNRDYKQLRYYANDSSACFKALDGTREGNSWLTYPNGLSSFTDLGEVETATDPDTNVRTVKYLKNDTWFIFPPPLPDTARLYLK